MILDILEGDGNMKPCKKEEQMLDKTLEIFSKDGASKAYEYLILEKEHLNVYSSQLYNFLYCLASVTGNKSAALAWLKEAIIEKGYWYRPEVFEDEDLDIIRNAPEFSEYKKISDEKYHIVYETANTLCSWEKVKADKLALILHGNQQNMHFGRDYWRFLEDEGWQVEYVQSKIIDSYCLYRWNEKGETQLDKIVSKISWDKYSITALCGFSSGCNEILNTLTKANVKCNEIILVSPWTPIIDDCLNDVINALNNVRIKIICGGNDEDCLPHAKTLHKTAIENSLNCNLEIINGCGHNYPEK